MFGPWDLRSGVNTSIAAPAAATTPVAVAGSLATTKLAPDSASDAACAAVATRAPKGTEGALLNARLWSPNSTASARSATAAATSASSSTCPMMTAAVEMSSWLGHSGSSTTPTVSQLRDHALRVGNHSVQQQLIAVDFDRQAHPIDHDRCAARRDALADSHGRLGSPYRLDLVAGLEPPHQ